MTDRKRDTFFDVWGPFEPLLPDGRVRGAQAAFWDTVEHRSEGLSGAIGCYMFCLTRGSSTRPWYVGKTASVDGFRGELFQNHKLLVWTDIQDAGHGTPSIFLFPLMTPAGRYSRAGTSNDPVIRWLEKYLMTAAFARNAEIRNIRDMTWLRRVEVRGVIGSRGGRPQSDVSAVRRALFGTSGRISDRST